MEFDIDSGGLAQKVQELSYEINAGGIRVAFQAVERAFFFQDLSYCLWGPPNLMCNGYQGVILGSVSRSEENNHSI